jgi:BirA family biotin operon repressor/biotin-[acetyl-CoA-carboxylase] ligase
MTELTPPSPTEAAAAADRGRRARSALEGCRFADVRWLASTSSTNADVLDLIRAGEPEGIVVVADHQHAGRGRRGRVWSAPVDGSLLLTVLLRPPAAVAGLSTMVLALAASDAVEGLTGVAPRLKWPNDLVWPGDGAGSDRKLAGILAEAEWPPGVGASSGWHPPGPAQRAAVAAGIGLNVAWGNRYPDDLRATAIALDEIVDGVPVPDRVELLVALLRALDDGYGRLVGADGPATVLDRWRARSATLGRRVRVDLGTDDVEGTAVDITADGHLVLDLVEGGRRVVAVGDVVHLRGS